MKVGRPRRDLDHDSLGGSQGGPLKLVKLSLWTSEVEVSEALTLFQSLIINLRFARHLTT